MMKIICLGDSLTRGYGVLPGKIWVELLNNQQKAHFVNKGINGDTTGGMLARFHYDVIEEKPNRVLIMGGVNDLITGTSPSTAQTNLMAMVHQAYSHGIVPIVGFPIRADEQTFRKDWAELTSVSELNASILEYHRLLSKLCRVFHIASIDFYTEFEKRTNGDYSRFILDGLHPNSEGHEILAEIAAEIR